MTLLRDPDATRTHDRLLRRQMLYPAELPDLRPCYGFLSLFCVCKVRNFFCYETVFIQKVYD